MTDEDICPHGNLVCVECLRLAKEAPSNPHLQPLIALIRKQLGASNHLTATAEELAQFVLEIVDLTLAEVDRQGTHAHNSPRVLGERRWGGLAETLSISQVSSVTPKDAVRWMQAHLGPINRLPSWLNELLSGFLCVGLAYGILRLLGASQFTFPLAFVLSEGYEHLLDPWGFNPQDVVERVRGIGLLMLVAALW